MSRDLEASALSGIDRLGYGSVSLIAGGGPSEREDPPGIENPIGAVASATVTAAAAAAAAATGLSPAARNSSCKCASWVGPSGLVGTPASLAAAAIALAGPPPLV